MRTVVVTIVKLSAKDNYGNNSKNHQRVCQQNIRKITHELSTRKSKNLLDALQALPGIKEIDIDLPTGLEDIKTDDLSLPGPFAELPHAALRRTKGGLEKRSIITDFSLNWKQHHQRTKAWN